MRNYRAVVVAAPLLAAPMAGKRTDLAVCRLAGCADYALIFERELGS